ncbi:MAG: hypothetical protein A3F42_05180 [Gammaproteobacteria bacterium RIFCSPHIGHO2_12_FULL_37_34]|nr:MAG: hypothetical protein A3F42_05180 [Gammaproteobacteria bacterium RIFCSPHIGHO2_12_FULL_37_34]
MKRLLIILNQDIKPFGKVLNAIGHMAIGIAPRFPHGKLPIIQLYTAPTSLLHDFRHAVSKLHQQLSDQSCVVADFAHTTTDGTAKDHEIQTKLTKESEICYFAVCACAQDQDLIFLDKQLIGNVGYQQLAISESISSQQQAIFDFTAPISYPEAATFTEEQKKFSIVLSNKLSIPDSIYSLVKATIELGRNASREALRLHQYPDADGILHPGMSEFGLVALKTKKPTVLDTLRNEASNYAFDSTGFCTEKKGELVAFSLFGRTEMINAATKKNLSLWTGDLTHFKM